MPIQRYNAMYTPSQAAEMLRIARSTVRKYARLYSDHLSESARRKQRMYTDGDIATLKRVVSLRTDGVPLDEISNSLGVVQVEGPQESLALIPDISQAFEETRAVLAQLRSDQEDTDQRLDDLNQRMDGLIDLIIEKLLPPE